MAKTKTAKEVEALEQRIAELEASKGDTRDTSAPEQSYPGIEDAPPVTEGEWQAEGPATAAPDQTYPTIEPAPPVVETAPVAGAKAAYVDPGKSKFAQALVEALVNAGLMDAE